MKFHECVGILVLTAGLAATAAAAETSVVPPGDYPAAAETEINAATSSVHLYLYLFNYQSARPNSGPARLARALVRARSRGVQVQAVLDRTADPLDPGAGFAKNQAAARFLAAGGVEVFVTTGSAILHAKALIIDGKTSLVGSSNWSASAFERNAEADVLIRSTEAARALLASFASLPKVPLPAPSTASVAVPLSFVDSPDEMGAVVRAADPRALDAYLHFLRGGARPGEPFPVDTETLAKAMALTGPARTDDRRQIHRALQRLRDNYRLLTFEETFNKDPVVTLSTSSEDAVDLPAAYFDLGWDHRLTLAGKAFLLWSLRYSADSPFPPRWSVAETDMARRFNVSPWFLQQGIIELRRANLLEVEYAPVSKTGNDSHRPSIYTPNDLYDPAALDARFRALEVRDANAFARAKDLAALVYEDSDVEGIEEIMDLETKLDPSAIQEASQVLGAKDPDNPKRCMGYLLEFLRKRVPQK